MREAILYDKLPDGRVKCRMCQWECTVNPGHYGVCRVRYNDSGTFYALNYGEVSAVHVDPIEKKPMAHFYPTTTVFSLGSWGCNFHCKHCQNWEISFTTPWGNPGDSRYLSPEDAISLTKHYGCAGIAWTYNEPSIWLEYTLDCAKLAKKEGLYTVYVTNGYHTAQALDTIGPYLDAYRVDIKGYTKRFHQELAKVSFIQGIFDGAVRAKEKWDMHVEVVTNIIPTMNDDDEGIRNIARWIKDALGELTPWHVTAFHPDHKLIHLPSTPIATLERAYRIGKSEGLRFIYVGNVMGHPYENTYCYSCNALVINRVGYRTQVLGLEGSRCKFCGVELNFRTSPRKVAV